MSQEDAIWAIGLMSGTSLDGIDAALIKTDGDFITEFGPSLTIPYTEETKRMLHEVLRGNGDVLAVERDLTLLHADAVKTLLEQASMQAKDISVIGFHGQTIMHRPDEGLTWQIGNGSLLAHKTKIDVVCDFRRRDVAAGGQGAPLVPLYQAALSRHLELPIAIVNIGGVANVTWIGRSEPNIQNLIAYDILAFDTGPGNALINDWAHKTTGQDCDVDAKLALAGKVHEKFLAELLDNSYFSKHPPKSLDRNHFNVKPPLLISKEDGAATYSEFTVRTIAKAADFFPRPAAQWFITGGGRHNPYIMEGLKKHFLQVFPVESLGWVGDAMEAQAFAFLAVRSLKGFPLTLPTTTGAARAVTGGALYRA